MSPFARFMAVALASLGTIHGAQVTGDLRFHEVDTARAGRLPEALTFLYSSRLDTGSVLSAIDGLFEAMRARDTVALRRVLHYSMTVATAVRRNGTDVILTLTADALVAAVGHITGAAWDQSLIAPAVRIDGALASVWSEYIFKRGAALDHCGTIALHLALENGDWKVLQLSDTHRTDCVRSSEPSR